MDKKAYLSIIAALVTIAAVWLFMLLTAPIAKPLAWALIIGIATFPHHTRLTGKLPNHPNRSAGLMVLAILFCLILPISFLTVRIVQNAADWYSQGQQLFFGLAGNGAGRLKDIPFVRDILVTGESFGIDISGLFAKLATNASGYIIEMSTTAAKSLGELLFTLAVALFMLFFIYRDGEKLVSSAIIRFATNQGKAFRYFLEIRDTTVAVTVGTFFTCLVQGAIAALGYYTAGVPAPFLFGALTSFAALVPVVGTGIIWVPIVALIAVNGAYLKAILLALWCLFLVGLADNAIRPLAIGAKSDIPVPAIVLGAICGVFSLGVLGLILGPVLFSVIITRWQDLTSSDATETSDEANVTIHH